MNTTHLQRSMRSISNDLAAAHESFKAEETQDGPPRYTHICLSAPTWESLPTAIVAMQESITTGAVPLLPSADQLAAAQEKNWLEIFIGETYPQECVLRVPMAA